VEFSYNRVWATFTFFSIDSNEYLFYVSFAGLGLEGAGLGLDLGLVTAAGLDYNTDLFRVDRKTEDVCFLR